MRKRTIGNEVREVPSPVSCATVNMVNKHFGFTLNELEASEKFEQRSDMN